MSHKGKILLDDSILSSGLFTMNECYPVMSKFKESSFPLFSIDESYTKVPGYSNTIKITIGTTKVDVIFLGLTKSGGDISYVSIGYEDLFLSGRLFKVSHTPVKSIVIDGDSSISEILLRYKHVSNISFSNVVCECIRHSGIFVDMMGSYDEDHFHMYPILSKSGFYIYERQGCK